MLCETCGIQHRKGCPIGEIRGTWEIYKYSHKVGLTLYYYWMRCVACGYVTCKHLNNTKNTCRGCYALSILETHSQDIELVSTALPANNTSYKVGLYCYTCHRFWAARLSHIQQGTGCPHCVYHSPKTEQDYIHLAKERGFTWKEIKIPKKAQDKTLWKCSNGHVWSASYSSIQQGRGCPYCYGNVPKIEQDYYALATERGIIWEGETLPKNVISPTLWKCPVGHMWSVPYDNIRGGTGCPYCARQPEGYVYLIRGIGGTLNGKYKLGHSNNPDRRLSELVRGYDIDDLSLLCTISTQDRFVLERYLHERYAQYQHPTPENGREWFTLPFADVLWLEELSHYTTVDVSEGILVASR